MIDRSLDLELIDIKEAAKYLQVCDMTIYRGLKSGELKGGVKIGGHWRISKKHFLEGLGNDTHTL